MLLFMTWVIALLLFFCWLIFDCNWQVSYEFWLWDSYIWLMINVQLWNLWFFLFEHVIWIKIVLKLMHIWSPQIWKGVSYILLIFGSLVDCTAAWLFSVIFLHVVFNASVTYNMRGIQLKSQFCHVRYVTCLERSMLESLDSLFYGSDFIRFVVLDMPMCGGISCYVLAHSCS